MPRPIGRISFYSGFEKEFDRLPKQIQALARRKDKMFRRDAFHPSLETDKLSGRLKDDWAYSVNRDYRVHFYFTDDHSVMYVSIGTHEIYK